MLLLQEPFVNIPDDKIREALKVVLGTAPFYFFQDEGSITSGFLHLGMHTDNYIFL
jgi:hypothetical protein